MACPACKHPLALLIGPLFRLRRRRWFDRFVHPADDLRVPGLTKLWAGYDCICANPKCAVQYRATTRGASLVNGAPARLKAQPEALEAITDNDDDEPLGQFPLDPDLILPGERTKR